MVAAVADFSQTGMIPTLHNLGGRPVDELEAELIEWGRRYPMALVLPCLYSELEGPALSNMIDEIAQIPYLNEIIIGLDRADEDQFRHAREFFGRLPQRHHVLWNDGPRLREIHRRLGEDGLAPAEAGKGRNVWYCLGHFLATGTSMAVALHDCDILTYRRDMVAKLFYPVIHPAFGYAFCKGYYFRAAAGTLNGRVTRLLVWPLIRALRATVGPSEYLDFIEGFRYPLAGEFSMMLNVVRSIQIPSDWGLEIGVLSEVQRRYTPSRICQVDIADGYDHKHQDLSLDDPTSGLNKMSTDIAKAFYRKLAVNGQVFTPEVFRTLKASYHRNALDLVDHYQADAMLNGITLDRHAEENAVELFAENIVRAGETFLSNPDTSPFLASWSRVMSAQPDILDDMKLAVAQDQAMV